MNNDAANPGTRQATTILVPLDGSQSALAALPTARVVAKAVSATVNILHVAPAHLTRRQLLDTLKLPADQVRGIVIDQSAGPIATTIAKEAGHRGSSFIAMTTYGREPAQVLGPVALEVLRLAPCPVILVRPDVPAPPGGPKTILRHMLLPLDGTPSTSAATAPAIQLAERSGAALDILLVAIGGRSRPVERGTFVAPRYIDQPHHEWPVWTQEFISRLGRSLGALPSVPTRLSVASGNPAEEILRLAKERDSDLIGLVWRGRLNGERGAIIKAVLRGALCPILILRAPRSA